MKPKTSVNQKKLKSYDAALLITWSIGCNLDCEYCISKQQLKDLKSDRVIPSFLEVLENTGKTFDIYFGGIGEPFLISNLIEFCQEIIKKHYVSFSTNLIHPKIKEFAEQINPQRVNFLRASAHIKELERKNLLDTYFDNFLLLKNKGFPVIAIEVAHPSILPEVRKYKRLFAKKGIDLQFNCFKGKYHDKIYPHSYSKKEIKIFGITPEIYFQHQEICNVGYNAGIVLPNGDIQPCYHQTENIGNIYREIKFKKNMTFCPFEFCDCPINKFDPYLFSKALEETNNIKT